MFELARCSNNETPPHPPPGAAVRSRVTVLRAPETFGTVIKSGPVGAGGELSKEIPRAARTRSGNFSGTCRSRGTTLSVTPDVMNKFNALSGKCNAKCRQPTECLGNDLELRDRDDTLMTAVSVDDPSFPLFPRCEHLSRVHPGSLATCQRRGQMFLALERLYFERRDVNAFFPGEITFPFVNRCPINHRAPIQFSIFRDGPDQSLR